MRFASQPLEITPFRLTHPFPLAYTPLAAFQGELRKQAGWNILIRMNFLARTVRFIFWLLVISWSAWLLRRFVDWMLRKAVTDSQQSAGASAAVQTPGAARRLVRDPVCGTHVDETLSIPLREGGELVHFCSTACRDRYAVSTQKFAAHG